MFACVVLCLVSSVASQEIGFKQRLLNDLTGHTSPNCVLTPLHQAIYIKGQMPHP